MFGCAPKAVDSDSSVSVFTVDCPTVGNALMTLTGANLLGRFDVTLGTTLIPFESGNVFMPVNGTILQFLLPKGSGQALSVSVRIWYFMDVSVYVFHDYCVFFRLNQIPAVCRATRC